MSGMIKNYKDELIKYPVFLLASSAAKFTGAKIYVVGGFVRDLVLGIDNDDIDFLCVGDGIKVAQEFSKLTHGELTVYENFGTAMVKYGDQKVEFVGARKEVYERGSRKPFVFDGTLEDDIMRRDFTINAMCISINEGSFGDLIDLVGGLDDLDDGIIRCVGDPVERFSEDPLRMLRCIRFKCKLSTGGRQFMIATKTIEGIKKCKDGIKTLSGERITEELNKIMSSQNPSSGIRWLDAMGLLEYILPEVHALRMPGDKGHKDIFEHTLQVLDNVVAKSDDLYLRWAALLHDIGKVPTKKYDEKRGWTFESHAPAGAKMVEKIFRRLHLPLDSRMEYVRKLVDMHMRPTTLAEEGVTDSAIRRLIFDAGDTLDALLILAKSDVTTRYEERRNKIYNNLVIIEKHIQEVEEKDALRNWKNPIDGNYIMETFGIGPCKTVAVLKDAVKEAILDGVIGNNFDEAEAFVKKKAKEIGLV